MQQSMSQPSFVGRSISALELGIVLIFVKAVSSLIVVLQGISQMGLSSAGKWSWFYPSSSTTELLVIKDYKEQILATQPMSPPPRAQSTVRQKRPP